MGLGLESPVGSGVAQDLGLVADVRDEQRIDPRPIPPIYLPYISHIPPTYLPHISPYLATSHRYSASSVSTLGSPRYDEDGCST